MKKTADTVFEEQIKTYIDNCTYVSFDIFDTILFRNVSSPTDIFRVIETRIDVPNQFSQLRERVECELRRNSASNEVTLSEIYSELETRLGISCDEIFDIEVQLEYEFAICNEQIKKWFDYAVENNKDVFLVTDMYLPSAIISKLVTGVGYKGFSGIYVSSELNASKARGDLYEYILRDRSISEKLSWVHIGDNHISDYKHAKKYGINALYYKRNYAHQKHQDITDSIVFALANNTAENGRSFWSSFGAKYVAPLYCGMLLWLIEALRGEPNIYFLARDGYTPHKLYEIAKQKYPDLPAGTYLYASRRAFLYPLLVNEPREEAISFLLLHNKGFNQKLTLNEILSNCGLNPNAYASQIKACGLSNSSEELTSDNREKFISFLQLIWGDIDKEFRKEKAMLEAYLEQSGLTSASKVNLFDIGWRGSTHHAISKLISAPVHGFYLGTFDNFIDEIRDHSSSYLVHHGVPFKNRNFLLKYVMLFELFFSAPHGTLLKFENSNGGVQPVLKDVEKNTDLNEAVREMQGAILQMFEKLMAYIEYLDIPQKQALLRNLESVFIRPESTTLLQFSKLTNAVGFGDAKDVQRYVERILLEDYLENAKDIHKHIQKNLWPDSAVIIDNQGRPFNIEEVHKLYSVGKRTDFRRLKTIGSYILKSIKNPMKAYSVLKSMIGLK